MRVLGELWRDGVRSLLKVRGFLVSELFFYGFFVFFQFGSVVGKVGVMVLIEGVGDEVIIFFAVFVCFLVLVFVWVLIYIVEGINLLFQTLGILILVQFSEVMVVIDSIRGEVLGIEIFSLRYRGQVVQLEFGIQFLVTSLFSDFFQEFLVLRLKFFNDLEQVVRVWFYDIIGFLKR